MCSTSATESANRNSRALQLEHDNLAIRAWPALDVFVPLFEQLAIERRACAIGVGNNLALRQRGQQMLGQPPLQDPAKRHRHDIVEVDIVESDDLMRHSGPKRRDAAGLNGDALAANQIGERAPIEKIDLDFVVPIGSRHLPRLPDFAGKAVGREVASPAIEMVHDLGFGLNHGLSIVPKLTGIQGELNNSLSHNRGTLSDLDNL